MYREHGKAGCDLPTIRTTELDTILAEQFQKLVKAPETDYPHGVGFGYGYKADSRPIQGNLPTTSADTAVGGQEGKVTGTEYGRRHYHAGVQKRNSRFNEQITALQTQTISLQQQEQQKQSAAADTAALEKGIMGRSELQGADPIRSGCHDPRPRCGM